MEDLNLNFEDCFETNRFQYPVHRNGNFIGASNYLTEYWLPNEEIFVFCLRNGNEYLSLKLAKIALGVNSDDIIVRN